MQKTEGDPLGPGFGRRLHRELDRIQPGRSLPRYATRRRRPLRLAPIALAGGIAGMLALTAFAATGSPNPAVWTQRVVTVIETNSAGSPGSDEHRSGPPAGQTQAPEREASPEPTEKPGAAESPEPRGSLEPAESAEASEDSG